MAPPPGRRRRLNCGPAPAGPGAPQAACAADSANAADSAPRAAGAGLAALLAPLGLPEFLTRHFGRAPLVLRGRPERAALAAALVSFERVIEAAAAGPARRRGSILMHLHHLPPAALDRLTHELARSLGADVWPNIYATGGAGTALDFHFDAHEVLALQCEGRKEWRVSRVRADRPLDLPALAASLRGTLEALRARALEETLFVETLDPGDLLYLPRSQFHNARSAAGRSLHVSFGIAPLSGIDAIEALAALALGDPALRDWLPLPGEDAHRMARRSARRTRRQPRARGAAR